MAVLPTGSTWELGVNTSCTQVRARIRFPLKALGIRLDMAMPPSVETWLEGWAGDRTEVGTVRGNFVYSFGLNVLNFKLVIILRRFKGPRRYGTALALMQPE